MTQYNVVILVDIPENFVNAYITNYDSGLTNALNLLQYLEIGDGVNPYTVGQDAFLQQSVTNTSGGLKFFDNLNILIIQNNVTLNGGTFSMKGTTFNSEALFPVLQRFILGCNTNTADTNNLTDFGQDTTNSSTILNIPQIVHLIFLSTCNFQYPHLFSTVIFGSGLPSPLQTRLSVLAGGTQHIQLLNSLTGAALSQYFSPQTTGAVSSNFNNFINSTLTNNTLSSPANWDFATQNSYGDNIPPTPTPGFAQLFTVNPDTPIGTYIGTILISDEYTFPNYNGVPYNGDPLGFVIPTLPNPNYFSLSPSGVITLIQSLPVTFDSEILQFNAIDSTETVLVSGTVTIQNVNIPTPNGIITITSGQTFVVKSNASSNSVVGTITANAPNTSRFTFSILSESEYISLLEEAFAVTNDHTNIPA